MVNIQAKEQRKIADILQLAVLRPEFRKALSTDPSKAIDSVKTELEFDSSKLTKESLDALKSVTEGELEALSNIVKKFKDHGIQVSDFPF